MRRTRFVRSARKKAIWANVTINSQAFTETVGSALLLTPEDWEAQFTGYANETAVLRAVVGEALIQQTTVGTAGNACIWGIYIADKDSTVPPSFQTTGGMGDYDWLHTGAQGVAGTLVTQTSASLGHYPLRIKAKRRLRSRDAIWIAAQYMSDATAPAGTMGGIFRFLVARD